MQSQTSAPLTFEQLSEREPRLVDLAEQIKSLKPTNGTVLRLWYGNADTAGIKDALLSLVGHAATNPQLRTSDAYDVAYDHLYGLLSGRKR